MANPILAIIPGEMEMGGSSKDEGNAKKREAAAKELISGVKGNDPGAVADAMTALYRLCQLDEE